MRKGPLNSKYIRVEVRIGLIIREVIRTGQVVGTGDSSQIVGPDRTIEIAIFKETLEGMVDKIIEEVIAIIDIMITIEAGIDQEKGHLQEIIVVAEIEVQVTVDQDQDLELVQIETGKDVINVGNMIILQEIALILEERDLEQLQQMLNMEDKLI